MLISPQTALHQVVDRPLEVALYELVKACVAAHAINPALHRVLNEQVPRINQSAAEAKILKLLREFLQQRGDQVHFHNLGLTVFILERTVESLTEAAVVEHPEFLKDEQLEIELTQLLLSYLRAKN